MCVLLTLVQSMVCIEFAAIGYAFNMGDNQEENIDVLISKDSLVDNSKYYNNSISEKPQQLRVCTFNMARDWESFRSKSNESFSLWQIEYYRKLFEKIDPDFLCMQEAYGKKVDGAREPGDYIDIAHKYNLFDTTMSDRFIAMTPTTAIDLRIASKYEYSDFKRAYLNEEVSNRVYQRILIPLNRKTIGLYNTHLSYRGEYKDLQKPEMEALCTIMHEDLRNHVCDYTIACGDFNVWENSNFQVFVQNGFKIANCGEFGNYVTWAFENYVDANDNDKHWNMSCLDNIIVSDNIEILDVGTVELYEPFAAETAPAQWPIWDSKTDTPNALSDHYPLFMDFIIQ